MPKELKPAIYLAGGMENDKNLGAGWRDVLTPALIERGYAVLNPCEFEPDQLKGLHTSRLPESVTSTNGDILKPEHWHQLKYADRKSSSYQRFKKYMQRIIRYDLRVLDGEVDVVVCYWTKATAKGAGTHSELTFSFMKGLPVYVVLGKGVDLPGWAHGCSTKICDNFDELLYELDREG